MSLDFVVACLFCIAVYGLFRFVCYVYDIATPDKHGRTKSNSVIIKILYIIFRLVHLILIVVAICLAIKQIDDLIQKK